MSKVGDLLARPLPAPPDRLRVGPFREGTFSSGIRSERTTSILGLLLAATFSICFITGLISHFIQQPVWWLSWPTRPISLYRITQGLHVATGLVSIPLLLAKLWSVFPKLFTWPPVKNLAEGASRLGILVLIGTAMFQLLSGLVNIARWYAAMPFFFTVAHYWTAWIAIGSLLMHIGAKMYIVRRSLVAPPVSDRAAPAGALPRRGFLLAVGVGAGVVTLATVGQTVPGLQAISRLAPRVPDSGPQGLPVNKSAVAAGVLKTAVDPGYALTVIGPQTTKLTLADLAAMPQHTVRLPIACVEGWSASATWTGVRLSDVLAKAGFSPNAADSDGVVRAESIQTGGLYRASEMPAYLSADPQTLLALRLNGEVLHIDHGYPVRLIAPNRPGVLQTKWVNKIAVSGGGDQ